MNDRLSISTGMLLASTICLALNPCFAQEKAEADSVEISPLRLEAAKTDLDGLKPREYLAAKDRKGDIFLLDVNKEQVLEFSKAGKSRDAIHLKKTPETARGIAARGFDVSPDGNYFGIATGEELLVFEGEDFQRSIKLEDPPAVIFSLAFVDSEPEIALTRMFVAPAEAFPSILESSHVIMKVDSEGKLSPFALPIDVDKDPVPLASLKEMCSLQLDEDGKLWAATKSRYLIRGFKASGKQEIEITDKDVSAEITERDFDPDAAEVPKDLSGDNKVSSSWSGSMNTVIRTFEVSGGKLWLIVNADIPGGQRLDILDIDSGKVESVELPASLPTFGTIAVNDQLIVFGTVDAEGHPQAFDLTVLERELEKRETPRILDRKKAEEKIAASTAP